MLKYLLAIFGDCLSRFVRPTFLPTYINPNFDLTALNYLI